ncbi:ABC transporter, ATP-binding protein [Ancylostoma ceylanicum]|uniref:ABC transporter, ATP-binding protein n=1 Tax=Ancylostoma ceylanicum TaxID=53326 RepID=A0A0D6MAW0_9BILA|nr:ABC transporter, ATP-binding protein [Ancylostoma ceylanicum]
MWAPLIPMLHRVKEGLAQHMTVPLQHLCAHEFRSSDFEKAINANTTQSRDEESSWHQTERRGSTEPDIIVDNVSKIWERTGELAVHEFSLKAYPGDVTVLLGHNGAGKSTTYAMICGTTPATRGTITVCGLRIDQNLNECRKKMGFCPQNNCIFFHLTVDDHLWFFFKLKGGEGDWQEEASDLCEKLKMENIRGRMAGKLSGGEKRKLCVAMAFIGGSRLVMLDEPTAGMDPQSRRNVEVLVEKEKTQRCLLLTTHYMDEAEAMGDFVYIMQLGHSICSGTPLFLKKKFASEYIFNIALDVKRKGNETFIIEKLVKSFVPDSKMSDVNGRQLCFKLPKEAQKRMSLEIYAADILHLFEKISDVSLRRVKVAKFLIFDISKDKTLRRSVDRALEKFPDLQVLVYNTSDWLQSWSLQWPWVAGGVIVGSNTSQSNTSEISEGEDVVEEREHVVNKAADLVLSVEDLTKFYGKLCALKRTTYGIEHGECFGLVGANLCFEIFNIFQ